MFLLDSHLATVELYPTFSNGLHEGRKRVQHKHWILLGLLFKNNKIGSLGVGSIEIFMRYYDDVSEGFH